MKSGEEFEAVDLPWFLTMPWGWLLAAEIVGQSLRAYFQWTSWPYLNIYFLWSLLQAGWLSRVDQRSTTVYWYLGDLVLGYAATSGTVQDKFPALAIMLPLAIAVVTILGLFHFRRDMTRYFKSTDDLDLNLSGWMVYFFNSLYFQYKFGEVASFRRYNSLEITPAVKE